MNLSTSGLYRVVEDWLQRHPNAKRRLKKIIVLGVVSWAFGLGALYFAARWRPNFYSPAVDVTNVSYEVVENQIDDLLAAMETDGDWEFTFSEEHINKWIDIDLPKTLPHVVPRYVRDPRVAIRDEVAHIAGEYRNGNVALVLSIFVEPVVTGRPNEIGLRFSNSKIGAVPGLMSEATNQVHWATRRGRMMIRWKDRDSSTPEATITLPHHQFGAKGKRITINDVVMADGRIHVSGNTKIVPVPKPKRRKRRARPKVTEKVAKTEMNRTMPKALKKIYIDQAFIGCKTLARIY